VLVAGRDARHEPDGSAKAFCGCPIHANPSFAHVNIPARHPQDGGPFYISWALSPICLNMVSPNAETRRERGLSRRSICREYATIEIGKPRASFNTACQPIEIQRCFLFPVIHRPHPQYLVV
jgi:hypothetical protein